MRICRKMFAHEEERGEGSRKTSVKIYREKSFRDCTQSASDQANAISSILSMLSSRTRVRRFGEGKVTKNVGNRLSRFPCLTIK